MKQTILAMSCLTLLISGCGSLPKVDFSPPDPVKVITEEVRMERHELSPRGGRAHRQVHLGIRVYGKKRRAKGQGQHGPKTIRLAR